MNDYKAIPELAAALGVSPQSVQAKTKRPGFPRPADNFAPARYSLRQVQEWYRTNLRRGRVIDKLRAPGQPPAAPAAGLAALADTAFATLAAKLPAVQEVDLARIFPPGHFIDGTADNDLKLTVVLRWDPACKVNAARAVAAVAQDLARQGHPIHELALVYTGDFKE